jgi:hypothetical protein
MASDLLEATAIQNPDQTSLPAEDATMFKQAEGFGYRGAANSKAPREQILRDWKFIHIAAILRSEKPARQPLQERVPKTARHGLRALHQGDVQIAVQNCPQARNLRHGAIEVLHPDPQRAAADLHEMTKCRGPNAESGSASDRPLSSDQPNLDGIAFVSLGENGHESLLDKVKMLDRNSGMLENASRGQGHPVQQGTQALQVLSGQRSQQKVARKGGLSTEGQTRLVLIDPRLVGSHDTMTP